MLLFEESETSDVPNVCCTLENHFREIVPVQFKSVVFPTHIRYETYNSENIDDDQEIIIDKRSIKSTYHHQNYLIDTEGNYDGTSGLHEI